MRAQELEPETEQLLLRIIPGLAAQWRGASDEEIERIERIADCPLPRFYRWFLARMGRSMGPISFPTVDFSVQKIISDYADGVLLQDPRFLMIGHESNQDGSLNLFYDFDHPERDDARVTRMRRPNEDEYPQFETFREMLAWGQVLKNCVSKQQQRCGGVLEDRDGDVLARVGPLLRNLGFTSPIPTGPHCGIFESSHACFVSTSEPGDEPGSHAFRLGGPDVGRLRRILGEITSEPAIELEIMEWDPPLT